MAAVTTDSKAVSSVKSESRIGAETNHDAASGANSIRRLRGVFPVAASRFALVRNPFARHLHHF